MRAKIFERRLLRLWQAAQRQCRLERELILLCDRQQETVVMRRTIETTSRRQLHQTHPLHTIAMDLPLRQLMSILRTVTIAIFHLSQRHRQHQRVLRIESAATSGHHFLLPLPTTITTLVTGI